MDKKVFILVEQVFDITSDEDKELNKLINKEGGKTFLVDDALIALDTIIHVNATSKEDEVAVDIGTGRFQIKTSMKSFISKLEETSQITVINLK